MRPKGWGQAAGPASDIKGLPCTLPTLPPSVPSPTRVGLTLAVEPRRQSDCNVHSHTVCNKGSLFLGSAPDASLPFPVAVVHKHTSESLPLNPPPLCRPPLLLWCREVSP